jgi:hypothetical protein
MVQISSTLVSSSLAIKPAVEFQPRAFLRDGAGDCNDLNKKIAERRKDLDAAAERHKPIREEYESRLEKVQTAKTLDAMTEAEAELGSIKEKFNQSQQIIDEIGAELFLMTELLDEITCKNDPPSAPATEPEKKPIPFKKPETNLKMVRLPDGPKVREWKPFTLPVTIPVYEPDPRANPYGLPRGIDPGVAREMLEARFQERGPSPVALTANYIGLSCLAATASGVAVGTVEAAPVLLPRLIPAAAPRLVPAVRTAFLASAGMAGASTTNGSPETADPFWTYSPIENASANKGTFYDKNGKSLTQEKPPLYIDKDHNLYVIAPNGDYTSYRGFGGFYLTDGGTDFILGESRFKAIFGRKITVINQAGQLLEEKIKVEKQKE